MAQIDWSFLPFPVEVDIAVQVFYDYVPKIELTWVANMTTDLLMYYVQKLPSAHRTQYIGRA